MFRSLSESLYPVSLVAVVAICIVAASLGGKPNALAKDQQRVVLTKAGQKSHPVAVVELFTSEGCSSCPPADANLMRIAEANSKSQSESSSQGDQQIFTLSFHVDYWNSLGWKDPFSQAAFSQRQRAYAQALDSNQVYTPQIIVNGLKEFVGSNKAVSDHTIGEALNQPAKHIVSIEKTGVERSSSLSLRYEVLGTEAESLDQYVLNVAVVSNSETVSVENGENGGRTLSHVNVVKSLKVLPLDSISGMFDIERSLVQRGRTHVVAYLQSKKTFEISGASAIGL
jgi:hypothetical protein